MRPGRTLLLTTAAALVMATATPASGANLLCPQLCLTGGLLGGSRALAAVSSDTAETRSYNYGWTALDGSAAQPGVAQFGIAIFASGGTSGGTFTGNGTATLSKGGGGSTSVPVTVTDDGATVRATGSGGGKTFALAAASPSGTGTASLVSTVDPGFDGGSPPDGGGGGDCDRHDHQNGGGHGGSNGGGHDCD